ncbi:hypothetical protein J6590_099321 [Homalodisca vitripennis]|nr:hypothetical protein J6590_099321 [Homalodisca vitripennis]
MATETCPLVSSVGRPAPPPSITSVPQPMTLPRDLASPDQRHVHVARPHELRNNKEFVSCVPKGHFAIPCQFYPGTELISTDKRMANDRHISDARNKSKAVWEVVHRETGKQVSKRQENVTLVLNGKTIVKT